MSLEHCRRIAGHPCPGENRSDPRCFLEHADNARDPLGPALAHVDGIAGDHDVHGSGRSLETGVDEDVLHSPCASSRREPVIGCDEDIRVLEQSTLSQTLEQPSNLGIDGARNTDTVSGAPMPRP